MAKRKDTPNPEENNQQKKPRKRPRRIKGTGSVYPRSDGRWGADFIEEATGKKRTLYGKTATEAQAKLDKALFEQKQGILATGPNQTVKQFLEYWYENVQKPTVRVTTYHSARALIYTHLIPGLGHYKLQKLTAQHVQAFYAQKMKDGVSASRIRQMQAMLHKSLTYARRLKLVGSNVTEDVQLPKYEGYDAPVLTPEQAKLLLTCARSRNLEVLLALAVATGMREGEILALRWSDIDMVKGTLQISRTLSYLPKLHFVEGKPKTKSSARNILLPQFLIDQLQAHRVAQEEQRQKVGASWIDRDLVFPNRVGNFTLPRKLLDRFHRLLEKAGLPPMRFHDLRHSAATILLSQGVQPNVVQELLGHSDVAITLGIYGAVTPSMTQGAARKMDSLFGENIIHQQWEGYSSQTRKYLDLLLQTYGEHAVQLALDAIKHLSD